MAQAILCGRVLRLLPSIAALAIAACASPHQIEVVLDKAEPDRLLRFYFGSYTEGGADPFAIGILSKRGQRYYVHPSMLEATRPGLGTELMRSAQGGVVTWDSLGAFLARTYYQARGLPPTIDSLKARWPYHQWQAYEVHGPMTRARRRIHVSTVALEAALREYTAIGRHLRYRAGTAIVADHYLEERLVEHTAMVRRKDGFWDFATYGPNGELTSATQALPHALKTPLQCVGCHFGAKQFEPERSFPLSAPPGPDGVRAYDIGPAARDAEVARYFAEHAKRSDTVLGLYATIHVSKLRAGRDTLSTANRRLLEDLGL